MQSSEYQRGWQAALERALAQCWDDPEDTGAGTLDPREIRRRIELLKKEASE